MALLMGRGNIQCSILKSYVYVRVRIYTCRPTTSPIRPNIQQKNSSVMIERTT